MAPIKVTTPKGEVKILSAENDIDHKFADMPGEIIKPGEPPTRADATQKVMDAYFNATEGEEVYPTNEAIDAELEHMQDLYHQGAFER